MGRILAGVRYAFDIARLAPDRRAALRNGLVTLELTARHRLGLDGSTRRVVVLENGARLVLLVEDISDLHAVGEVYRDRTYALPIRAERALEGVCETVADIGSHVGASVGWFRAYYPGARILAFEPDPRSFRKLAAVATRWSPVRLYPAAVAADTGRRMLSCPPDSHILSSLMGAPGGELVEVDCITLDDACARAGIARVDLVKLDVEGSELEVLSAFEGLSSVRVVVGEFHPGLVGERGRLHDSLPGFEIEWIDQAKGDPMFVAVNTRPL